LLDIVINFLNIVHILLFKKEFIQNEKNQDV
jgi:hypothetical protein